MAADKLDEQDAPNERRDHADAKPDACLWGMQQDA